MNKKDFVELSDDRKFILYIGLLGTLKRSRTIRARLLEINYFLVRRLESIKKQAEHGLEHPWSLVNHKDRRNKQWKKSKI